MNNQIGQEAVRREEGALFSIAHLGACRLPMAVHLTLLLWKGQKGWMLSLVSLVLSIL